MTKIVSSYKEGAVIAIDGEWGSGKTTFMKMWRQYLENNSFKTLYFNAWEDDFVSDPIVGLIGQLCKTSGLKEGIDSVLKTISKIAVGLIPNVAKNLTKKYFGENAAEIFEATTQGVSDLLFEEIKQYENQTKSIADFREEIQKLVKNSSENKPLVFIVDELDRCNPHYAVKVLERIKRLINYAS